MYGKLLIDDYPIQVLPKLASEIGLNEAIFIQQLHYWLNSKSVKNINGHKWIYNTYKDWQKQFPFWSVSTIKRTIASLEEKNLIIKGNFNKAGFDKTIWYSINYSAVKRLNDRMGQNDPIDEVNMTYGEGQNELCIGSKWTDGEGQNEPTNTIDYTETTTKTSSSSNNATAADNEEIELAFSTLKGNMLNQNDMMQIEATLQKFSKEEILNLIDELIERGKPIKSFNYVASVLESRKEEEKGFKPYQHKRVEEVEEKEMTKEEKEAFFNSFFS